MEEVARVEKSDMSLRRPFDPAAHDLEPSFRLTKFAELKGRGCKVPQDVLLKLLEGLQQQEGTSESEQSHFQYVAAVPRIGEYGLVPSERAPRGSFEGRENV